MSASDALQSPFLFVKRGDPDPVEWMQAHPGWVKFPAVMVPRPAGSTAQSRGPVQAADFEEGGSTSTTPGAPPNQGGAAGRGRQAASRLAPARRHKQPPVVERDAGDPIAAYKHTRQALSPANLAIVRGEMPPAPPAPTPLQAARERAFLRLLRWLENGDVSDEVAYHARFGGRDPMSDADMLNYKPKREIIKPRYGKSISAYAAGAYQINKNTWKDASRELGATDFTPGIQDQIARYFIAKDGAEESVRKGDLETAFVQLRRRWASLPGSTQSHHSLSESKSNTKAG